MLWSAPLLHKPASIMVDPALSNKRIPETLDPPPLTKIFLTTLSFGYTRASFASEGAATLWLPFVPSFKIALKNELKPHYIPIK
jgi:hypothetical protein